MARMLNRYAQKNQKLKIRGGELRNSVGGGVIAIRPALPDAGIPNAESHIVLTAS